MFQLKYSVNALEFCQSVRVHVQKKETRMLNPIFCPVTFLVAPCSVLYAIVDVQVARPFAARVHHNDVMQNTRIISGNHNLLK